MKCVDCKIELTENFAGPEKNTDDHYTELGNGPYCGTCYKKWQEIDDRLKQENEESEENERALQ